MSKFKAKSITGLKGMLQSNSGLLRDPPGSGHTGYAGITPTATQPCGHLRKTTLLLMVSINYKAYYNNLEQKQRNCKSEKLCAAYFHGLKVGKCI